LTLVREEGNSCDENVVERFVTERVPGALIMESADTELTFQLPSAGIIIVKLGRPSRYWFSTTKCHVLWHEVYSGNVLCRA